ncbi:hypothetical protein C8R43DRAFT_272215 [Mycena crocata]|nr:hypothetical protein C8R43DRAFT_272215 [Mycena crocata]
MEQISYPNILLSQHTAGHYSLDPRLSPLGPPLLISFPFPLHSNLVSLSQSKSKLNESLLHFYDKHNSFIILRPPACPMFPFLFLSLLLCFVHYLSLPPHSLRTVYPVLPALYYSLSSFLQVTMMNLVFAHS